LVVGCYLGVFWESCLVGLFGFGGYGGKINGSGGVELVCW
jgi:hypothetical protein